MSNSSIPNKPIIKQYRVYRTHSQPYYSTWEYCIRFLGILFYCTCVDKVSKYRSIEVSKYRSMEVWRR